MSSHAKQLDIITDVFWPLPQSRNYKNSIRQVGFEFEYSNLDIDTCSNLLINTFGGKIKDINRVKREIVDTDFGDFSIELDSAWIQKLHRDSSGDELGDRIKGLANNFISIAAEQIVPFEIVTPPIPLNQIERLELMRDKLSKGEAEGTSADIHYAFGMHINPEVQSLSAEYIIRVLKSFLILYPWLLKKLNVDFVRRMLTYIDPFPDDYIARVLTEGYSSLSINEFISEYIQFNPTRNRALDLLPLFAYINVVDLSELPDHNLIKARPTFHYRLPNCEFDNAQWRIAHGWNSWVLVEQLAADAQRLRRLEQEYIGFMNEHPFLVAKSWPDILEERFEG